MPYLGQNFVNYYNANLRVASKKEFVHQMLILSARLFEAVIVQMKGQYHGDIKPDNICIDDNGRINFIDFARNNNATRLYAAPEILANESLGTVQSDVYALARTLSCKIVRKTSAAIVFTLVIGISALKYTIPIFNKCKSPIISSFSFKTT